MSCWMLNLIKQGMEKMILNLGFLEKTNIISPLHKIISKIVDNESYGKSKNKADTFAKTGRRQQLTEQEVKRVKYSVFKADNLRFRN